MLGFGTYEIVTDVGMTPFVSEETLSGAYISSVSETHFFRSEDRFEGVAASVSMTYTPEHTLIER